MDKLIDMAGDHLATVHGADRGLSSQENESFRKLRWVVLPIVAVVLIALFAYL
ncbi:hypothetical protein [Streptomyces scopuliridis]